MTMPDPARLRQLRQNIVDTTENPESEFRPVWVGSLRIDRKNYQFGDTVNMYGGLDNTGIVKK
ncbi:hypothetical protein [Streptomyces canus]|uniref:hypothetical protein n=1 Tax=Streptomyces canus TaxID=58343 RepID=UPI003CEF240C